MARQLALTWINVKCNTHRQIMNSPKNKGQWTSRLSNSCWYNMMENQCWNVNNVALSFAWSGSHTVHLPEGKQSGPKYVTNSWNTDKNANKMYKKHCSIAHWVLSLSLSLSLWGVSCDEISHNRHLLEEKVALWSLARRVMLQKEWWCKLLKRGVWSLTWRNCQQGCISKVVDDYLTDLDGTTTARSHL